MKADAGELSFFVMLARHASLSATARELDVTPPAVTKRLALMEQRLGVRLVSRATPRGLLRVNAPLGFGRTTIAPLMSAYAKLHPDVEIELQLTDRPIDLVEQRFDLAVRFGELPDTRLSARRIMSNRRFLCASPAYLRRHGEPQTLAELAQHRCIIHRQNDDAYGIWRFTRNRKSEVVK